MEKERDVGLENGKEKQKGKNQCPCREGLLPDGTQCSGQHQRFGKGRRL